jgi:hypothetical protein
MTRLKLLPLWLLCLLGGLIAAVWMLCAVLASPRRALLIAKGFDQLGNATGGGDEDEFISSRAWRNRADPAYARLVRVINWLFNDPAHCRDSYESERARLQSRALGPQE